MSSLDVAKATSPSAKPLPARVNLPLERGILRKSSMVGKAEEGEEDEEETQAETVEIPESK